MNYAKESPTIQTRSNGGVRNLVVNMRGSPSACLFVASLNASLSEADLQKSVQEKFQSWGEILNVKVFKDWQKRPYAFVQFQNEEDARKALDEAQGIDLDGRRVRIEPARVNRALFVSRPSGAPLTKEEVYNELSRHGKLEEVTLLTDPERCQSNGMAFIKYSFREDAIQAFLEHRTDPNWHVEWANHIQREMHPVDKCSLFVGQLDPKLVTQEELTSRFGQYGEMQECTFVNRQDDQIYPRCAFAFIRYTEEDAATKAIAAEDGARWHGRSIRVQYREPRESAPTGGGRAPVPRKKPPPPVDTRPTAASANPYAYYSPYYAGYPSFFAEEVPQPLECSEGSGGSATAQRADSPPRLEQTSSPPMLYAQVPPNAAANYHQSMQYGLSSMPMPSPAVFVSPPSMVPSHSISMPMSAGNAPAMFHPMYPMFAAPPLSTPPTAPQMGEGAFLYHLPSPYYHYPAPVDVRKWTHQAYEQPPSTHQYFERQHQQQEIETSTATSASVEELCVEMSRLDSGYQEPSETPPNKGKLLPRRSSAG